MFLNNLDTKLTLVYLSLMFVFIIFLMDLYYYSKKSSYITINDFYQNKNLFIKYLDKYYITNIYFTVSKVTLYFILQLTIIILVRIFCNKTSKKNVISFPIDISNIENNLDYFFIINIINTLFLFIIIIILYKKLLNKIFFIEIHKLHIFLDRNKYYTKISYFLKNDYISESLGAIYLFFYNIAHLREKSDSNDYQTFNFHDTIYENKIIASLSTYIVYLCKKYFIIHIIFTICMKIIKIIYYRIVIFGLWNKIHYIFYFIFLLYDLLHLEIYYSFYMFFPFYIFTLILNYKEFLDKRNVARDCALNSYFYRNMFNYNVQRTLFLKNNLDYIESQKMSQENQFLFSNFYWEELIEYVTNNFIDSSLEFVINSKSNKTLRAISQRYYYLILLGIGVMTLILQNNLDYISLNNFNINIVYVLIGLYLFNVYVCINIRKSTKEVLDDLDNYIYNKKFHMLFWVINIIIIYLLYLSLIKGTLFLMVDSILWEGYNIKIIKFYSLEEKVTFFYDYLMKVFDNSNISEAQKEIILSFVGELDIRNIILENTTLKDLQVYITEIFIHYSEIVDKINNLIVEENTRIEQRLNKLRTIKAYMDCFSNITNFVCFYKFIAQGLFLRSIRSPETVLFVVKWFKLVVKLFYKNR